MNCLKVLISIIHKYDCTVIIPITEPPLSYNTLYSLSVSGTVCELVGDPLTINYTISEYTLSVYHAKQLLLAHGAKGFFFAMLRPFL